MVYGSGQRKKTNKGAGGIRIGVCAFLVLSAFVIKLIFPEMLTSEQVSKLLTNDWDITSVKAALTAPEEIKQFAKDLYNAVFNKKDKINVPEKTEDDMTLSTVSLRSYGVRDYLSMVGMSDAIKVPQAAEYVMPASGQITSLYGWREHPITGKASFHTGVDIAVNAGEQVCAVSDAVVADSGNDSVYGNYIVLTHPDGRQSFYAHLEKVFVAKDERVTAGQCIAHSGSTGLVTGPHLHFEMRKNGSSVDPLEYIGEAV